MKHTSFLFDTSEKGYIIADTEKKRIIYFNHTAQLQYALHEKTYSLEDIFIPHHRTLEDMITEAVETFKAEEISTSFKDIFTLNAENKQQLIDLTIGFLDKERLEIFFEFEFKPDDTERSLKNMIDNTSKAMFLANIDDNFTIYYANDLFYHIFGKDQIAFETFYKNSFLATLLDEHKGDFRDNITEFLKSNPDFHADIQVATVFGVKKWFYFDVQYRKISQGNIVYKGMLLPIADRVEIVKELEHVTSYFEAIQSLTSGALFYLNLKTKTLTHHSKLLKNAGFPEITNNFPKCTLHMFHPDDLPDFHDYLEAVCSGKKDFLELRYRVAANEYSWSRIESLPIFDEHGAVVEVVGKIKNIDDEKELIERATIDPLTNALNKDYVQEQVELILHNTEANTSHAFMFMDLDNFKYVNDNLGHRFGDFLLDTINEPFDDGEITHTIHGSIGIAVFPIHGRTYEELYHHADLALYRSKHRGKNMATVYQPTISGESPPEQKEPSSHGKTE